MKALLRAICEAFVSPMLRPAFYRESSFDRYAPVRQNTDTKLILFVCIAATIVVIFAW